MKFHVCNNRLQKDAKLEASLDYIARSLLKKKAYRSMHLPSSILNYKCSPIFTGMKKIIQKHIIFAYFQNT